ncbi:MAG: tyrosine-type recombinase/integrase [Aigarchaeota archaeon]|nr:tyrosine-type recombinase/integrase [Aigarchaeota archaeon]
MSLEVVRNDKTVQLVIENRGYGENMADQLVKAVKDFMEFLGKSSPSEVVESMRAMSADDIVKTFKQYFITRKKSLAPKSIFNWSNAVRVWLYENGIDMDLIGKKITREFRRYVAPKGIPKVLKRDYIDKEIIKKLLLVGDVRARALITLLASSGLRVDISALRLQLRHFKDDLNVELPCYKIEIPEALTKGELHPHITFISKECRDFLVAYLEQRKARGETLTPDSYLFVSRNGQRLTYRGALHLWNRLCKNANIDRSAVPLLGNKRQKHRFNIRLHSFRKYFKTTCSQFGVDRMAAEALQGHSLSAFGIESVYDFCVTNEKWLREQYMKALVGFTFLSEVSIVNGEAREKIRELEVEWKQKIHELETGFIKLARALVNFYTTLGYKEEELQIFVDAKDTMNIINILDKIKVKPESVEEFRKMIHNFIEEKLKKDGIIK